MRSIVRFRAWLHAATVAAVIVTPAIFGTHALAAGAPPPLPPLPAGAQPGGAQPQLPLAPLPLPDQGQGSFDVPPVIQRPLGVDEGARVFVKKFKITGVTADAGAGINAKDVRAVVDRQLEDIQTMVEKARKEHQGLTKVGPQGFTPDERKQILDFMQSAVTTLSPEEQQQQYQEFLSRLRLAKFQREQGFTIGQLQQVADKVTKYYHDKGYFLAHAVIPAQEVKDGVVEIRVLEGRLEKVIPEGNKRYSNARIEAPFKEMKGKLVTVPAVENALLTLTDYPGLAAFGVFRPGEAVGTSDLVVNVKQEKRFAFDVRADNHGTEFTGRKRLTADVTWNNPTGSADLFKLSAVKTFTPRNATYGRLHYQHPFFQPDYTWGVDVSRNTFDVGGADFAALGYGGISKIATLSLTKSFTRSRRHNVSGLVDFSRKRADTLQFGDLRNRDDLAVLGLQLNFDNIDPESATISSGSVRIDHGFAGRFGVPSTAQVSDPNFTPPVSRTGASGEVASGDFNKLTFAYSRLKSLTKNQTLLFRLNGQYSHDLLSSLEEFVIGGPNQVRAAPTAAYLTDSGAFASLEWSVRAPGFADKHAFGNYSWGDVLRFSVFTDHAVGLNNYPINPADKKVTIGGSGIGLEFTIPGKFTLNVEKARVNGGARAASGTTGSPVPDDSQLWVDMTVTF